MFKTSITPEEIAPLPLAEFPGKIFLIDSMGLAFNRAVRYLKRQKVIGFDTETRPSFSAGQPHHGTALLQLSGGNKAFLFRTCRIGMPGKLRGILSNPDVIKVGAAVADDIHGLQKLGPFNPESFVDLQRMVSDWGITDKSVKKMSAIILGVRISKAQQLSNWEAENLSDSQKMYGATDAWICREMYRKLLTTEKPEKSDGQDIPEEG